MTEQSAENVQHPEPLEEDVKERFEILRFISETHRGVRGQRRGAHLQIFLTTVTFYALIGAAKFTGKIQEPEECQLWFNIGVWVLLIAVAALFSLHRLGLHAINRVNRKLAESAENEIRQMVRLPDPDGAGKTISKTYLWEILMIIIFAVAVGFSITVL